MNFVGTGKRLAQNDIGDAARSLGVETAVLLAVIEIEAAGRGFDNQNRPKMLRETHIFYRELGNIPERQFAISQGLATKSWTRNYKSDSYPDLERMMNIDPYKALRSCSWGLPQIMGFNSKDAGNLSAVQMVETMKRGEREQLLCMVALLKSWGADKLLQGRDFAKADSWRPFAARYNGSGYATHGYHTKLATSYVKHRRGTSTPMQTIPTAPGAPTADTVLRHGMKGEAVRNLQNDLAFIGYMFRLGIDGRFGDETRDNVKNFQTRAGLKQDGVAGKQTLDALAKYVAEAKPRDNTASVPVWTEQSAWSKLVAAILSWWSK